MWRWGSDWLFADQDGDALGLQLVDVDSGDEVRPLVVDEHTGHPIDVRRIRLRLRR
jgi:hypothetical protein